MTITVNLHGAIKATPRTAGVTTWLGISDGDGISGVTIFMSAIKARAMADAFNFPAPDLLAMIDARLNEVEQTGDKQFRYRDYSIDGDDWFRDEATMDQHFSIFAAMDAIDSFRAVIDDPAATQEMADDDRAHALRERRDEVAREAAE